MSSEAQLEKQCKHEWPPSPRALIIPALLGFAVMLSGPFNAKGSDITDWSAIDLLAIKTLAITSLPHLPKDPLNSAAADSGRITATYTVRTIRSIVWASSVTPNCHINASPSEILSLICRNMWEPSRQHPCAVLLNAHLTCTMVSSQH